MMQYDREERRRKSEYKQEIAAQRKLEKKLEEQKRVAREAKKRLLSSTLNSETWHRMTLGWLDRKAGYEGGMASARVWLRSLPLPEYVQTLIPFANESPGAANLEIEVAAVKANLADWTDRGDALLLDRARRAYAADAASFAAWQRDHPDNETWRKKPQTRPQRHLIARIAEALDVDLPRNLNRGEAHDWIEEHGGNPRLSADVYAELPQGSSRPRPSALQDNEQACESDAEGKVSQ